LKKRDLGMRKIPKHIRAQISSSSKSNSLVSRDYTSPRQTGRERILADTGVMPSHAHRAINFHAPKDAQMTDRIIRRLMLNPERRLKSDDNIKSNGQCKCKKKEKTENEKKKEKFQHMSQLLIKRLKQSWKQCEFQKDEDTVCSRKEGVYCEFAKTDKMYGSKGFEYKKTVKESGEDKQKTVKLNSWQNQMFTKWRCVNIEVDDDEEFKYNPLKSSDDN